MCVKKVKQLRKYLKGTLQIHKDLALLQDARISPDYSTQLMGRSFLLGFTLRSRSVRQLERRLKKKGWRRFVGLRVVGGSPVEGTLRYFLPRLQTPSLQKAFGSSIKRMLRAKMAPVKTVGGLRVASLDGTTLFSCKVGACGGCIKHSRHRPHAEEGAPRVEYNEHKVVTARLIGDRFSPWLGYISQRPQSPLDENRFEGEQTALLRLLSQLEQDYGSLLDAILTDALHVSRAFIEGCEQRGWWATFISKENASSLQTGFESKPLSEPERERKKVKEGFVDATIWEQEDISLGTCDLPLRVLKILQTVTTVDGVLVREDVRWIGTRIPKDRLDAKGVWWLGWRRWESENGGHRTLKHQHHAKHVFCHKSPEAVENLLWFLMWGQNVLEVFALRRLNSGRYNGLADGVIGVVEELVEGMAVQPVKERWEIYPTMPDD